MRRHNPSTAGLYTGGAAVLPYRPAYNNYASRMQMHLLAKDQALGQYYSKLENGINPAGVRQQDMEGWQNKLQKWQQFGVENRNALINPNVDNGRSQRQFGAMHQDLLGDIQKSKAAGQNERAVQTIMLDPKRRAMTTNNDLQLAHKMSASIYDPNHFKEDGITPVAPEDFSFNAPPYDINKQRAVSQIVTRGLKKDRTYGKASAVDPVTRLTKVPFTEQNSPQNLKTIAERMGQVYDSDKSLQQHYDNNVLDPDTHDKLNKAYQSVYPNDDIGTDPRKQAMASAILDNSQQNAGAEMKSVSRPPIGRGVTKAQQAQQDMMGWTNGMASAIKSGDQNEIERYGNLLYNGKVTSTGVSRYQGVEQGPVSTGNPAGMNLPENIKPGVSFKHLDAVWNPAKSAYEDVLNTTSFDPNDPALVSKLGGLYQMHMGSAAPLKSGAVHQVVNQAPPPTAKPSAPATTAPLDPDALIKKYSQ